MRALVNKLKPSTGYSGIFHTIFNIVLPLTMFVLVRTDLPEIAALLVLVSKWRMFSVKPRHWLAIVQANAVDIIAGLSFVAFMISSTPNASTQFSWAVIYIIWLIVIKPGTTIFKTSLQSFIAQAVGLNAILITFTDASIISLMIMVWLVTYSCARHFFTAFEDSLTVTYAASWGYVGAAVMWLLGHWLLFYGQLAQITVLLSVLSFTLCSMYYLEHNDKLSLLLRRQLLFIMSAVLVVIVVFSDWSDKTI